MRLKNIDYHSPACQSPPFHDREGQCYLLEKLTVLIEDWFESKRLVKGALLCRMKVNLDHS